MLCFELYLLWCGTIEPCMVNAYKTGRRHGGFVIPMLFMCEGGVLFWFFFVFYFFFTGRMEEFDLGLTNILTQITDEDIRQMEGAALTTESQETGGRRLSLSGKAKRCVYSEEPRTVSIYWRFSLLWLWLGPGFKDW